MLNAQKAPPPLLCCPSETFIKLKGRKLELKGAPFRLTASLRAS